MDKNKGGFCGEKKLKHWDNWVESVGEWEEVGGQTESVLQPRENLFIVS